MSQGEHLYLLSSVLAAAVLTMASSLEGASFLMFTLCPNLYLYSFYLACPGSLHPSMTWVHLFGGVWVLLVFRWATNIVAGVGSAFLDFRRLVSQDVLLLLEVCALRRAVPVRLPESGCFFESVCVGFCGHFLGTYFDWMINPVDASLRCV